MSWMIEKSAGSKEEKISTASANNGTCRVSTPISIPFSDGWERCRQERGLIAKLNKGERGYPCNVSYQPSQF